MRGRDTDGFVCATPWARTAFVLFVRRLACCTAAPSLADAELREDGVEDGLCAGSLAEQGVEL